MTSASASSPGNNNDSNNNSSTNEMVATSTASGYTDGSTNNGSSAATANKPTTSTTATSSNPTSTDDNNTTTTAGTDTTTSTTTSSTVNENNNNNNNNDNNNGTNSTVGEVETGQTQTQAGEPTASTESAAASTLNAASTLAAAATQQIQQLQQRLTPSTTTSNDPPTTAALASSFRHRHKTLAFASTTPYFARFFIPLLCIATHVIFYYGQTADMWKLRLFSHVDVWANATEFKSKTTFDALGLDRNLNFKYDRDEDVETFTYWYAIRQLWIAKKMPSKTMPQLAAILLVLFSGVWPHLKLLLLQLTWWFGTTGIRRTRMLHWLSTLGKWSLADVLTVCVMVGVLHLNWDVDPGAIKSGLVSELPAMLGILETMTSSTEVCDYFLHMTCAKQKKINRIAKCKACWQVVHEAFTHPEWAQSTGRKILRGVKTSGGGIAYLRVEGMSGIYAFCAAVILSILISLIVDIFDHKNKQQEKQNELRRQAFQTTATAQQEQGGGAAVSTRRQRRQQRSRNEGTNNNNDEANSLQEPLLSNHLEVDLGQYDGDDMNNNNGDDDLSRLQRRFRPRYQQSRRLPTSSSGGDGDIYSGQYLVWALVTAAVVFFAVDLVTMERVVDGAAPTLLHEILGVNWERKYSLQSLMWTTGAAGSWDYLLMGTFALFCVFGPILRSALCVFLSLLDKLCCCCGDNRNNDDDENNNRFRRITVIGPLATTINFIGAFCAWEVFVIAILMVQMLMPSITNTIIQNPACSKVADDGSCLQVEFNVLPYDFSTIIIGGCLLLMTSFVAIRTANKRTEQYQQQDFHRLMMRTAPGNSGGRNGMFYQLVNSTDPTTTNHQDLMMSNDLEELVFETEHV